ncbi:NAD-dependent DNA ligase LigA [Actinoplanes regularis]|uniref:DNA ligase n=1 Tax=Actinoplanes regularis TaxID=52697 RepID=A0A239F2F7_9ACTN|nr:NAD-dependent DNA ligase LigA [Actinoplanes regularis]GIE89942.1 DNA ligase 2 [Actinoplanes regularis]SNS51180.1 DNA ligase (NAD+) [Actinoplanes regularis]
MIESTPVTAPFPARDAFDEAVAEARRAARAYYDTGDALLTDADYDLLADRIAATIAAHPDWDDQGITTAVAAGASAGGDVRHPTPMLSLDKIKTAEEVAAFVATLGGDGCLVEVKLDGLAIRVEYVEGRLVLAALRGDGATGEDVTPQVRRGIAGLPTQLPTPWSGEVRGEVYMTVTDFEEASANRVAAGGKAFVNSRGAVAGSIRAIDRDYEAPMTFAAYEISGEFGSHLAAMAHAESLGFPPACTLIAEAAGECHTAEQVIAAIETIGAHRSDLAFPIDGAVIKANLDSTRRRLGLASRTPYWATAFKYPPDTASTVLRDIEVRVGRTGRISLRAIIDPVMVGGTTVTKATLHNPQWVAEQGLALGQTVAVWRAGDVIPRVTAPIGEQPHGLTPWTAPEQCPQCGEPWDKSSLLWRCHTASCAAANALAYWCSREALDVDGAGDAFCDVLVEAGIARNVADLYDLTVDGIAELAVGKTAAGGTVTLGRSNAERIIAGLEASKRQPFNRVITGLGIRMTGRSVGRWLAARFKSMDALRAATVEEIAQIDKMGLIKAQHVVDGLVAMSEVIDRLAERGLTMRVEDDGGEKPLAGKTYVVSGSVPGYTRTTVSERIEALGGSASSSVSAKTTALVTAETTTSKAKKAAQLGIPVIDPEEFARLLA